MTNSDAGQRESCARVDYLSYLCVVCGDEFQPRRKDQVTCGNKKCRHGRPRLVIRKKEHEEYVIRTLARRRNRVLSEYRLFERGTPVRDHYTEKVKYVKDNTNKFSRCKQCGTEFLDGLGRPTPSPFEFCGESLLKTGDCKKLWLEARPQVVAKPAKFTVVTPEDTKPHKRVGVSKVIKMPRLLHNYCATCVEVVVRNGAEVRRTKGMYRPVDHECGEVVTQ